MLASCSSELGQLYVDLNDIDILPPASRVAAMKYQTIGSICFVVLTLSIPEAAVAQAPCGGMCRGQNPIYTYPAGGHIYAEYCLISKANYGQQCSDADCPAVCPFPTNDRRLRKAPKHPY